MKPNPESSISVPSGPLSNAGRLIRRVHMFTGLFLGPWMLMYALSTLMMTHREYVSSFYPTRTPALVTERELDYTRSFPASASREEIARQLLDDLGLPGRFSVSGGRNGQPLVVQRQHPVRLRRITLNQADNKLVVQRETFRISNFLERMHRRRGYDQPYAKEDAWGLSVDIAVAAMVFWSLSGLWLWWELRPARNWGALMLLAGPALFLIFLFLL